MRGSAPQILSVGLGTLALKLLRPPPASIPFKLPPPLSRLIFFPVGRPDGLRDGAPSQLTCASTASAPQMKEMMTTVTLSNEPFSIASAVNLSAAPL